MGAAQSSSAGHPPQCFHCDDTVARYAGDEFMVLLRLDHPENICPVLARLADTARRLYEAKRHAHAADRIPEDS